MFWYTLSNNNKNIYTFINTDRRKSRTSTNSPDNTTEIFQKKTKKKCFKLTKLQLTIILSLVLITIVTGLLVYLLKKGPQEIVTTTTSNPEVSTTNPETTTNYPGTTTNYPGTTTESTTTLTDTTTLSTSTSTEFTSTTLSVEDFMISRSDWTSDPIHQSISTLKVFPIKRIIVGQTDDSVSCFNKTDCISRIQSIRSNNPGLLDIPWNFLIGGDGRVYEGRGYRYEGEHSSNVNASNYNDIGLGIAFIGNFRDLAPPYAMQNVFNEFLLQSVENGNLTSNYKIFFQDQLIYKDLEATALKNTLRQLNKFYEGKIKF